MKKSALLILSALVLIPAARAAENGSKDSEFSLGLAAYGKKDYQAACEHFRKYMTGRSPDPRTTYYLALSNMQCNRMTRAKELFDYIAKNFPQSQEAGHARSALSRLGVSPSSSASASSAADSGSSSGTGASSDSGQLLGRYQGKRLVHSDAEYKKEFDAMPKESRVVYRQYGGDLLVPATINGKKLEMTFGKKWDSRLSFKDWKALGMEVPEGKPDDTEEDNSTKKKVGLWKKSIKVSVGDITRKVPVMVYEERHGVPELGRAFLEDINVNYDAGGKLLFKKGKEKLEEGKEASIASYQKEYSSLPDKAEIKFTHGEGGHMKVSAHVNGKPITCMFDTGASGYFGMNHLNQMGIKRPQGKPDSYATGWAGRPVPIWKIKARVKIGTIERVIPVSVSESWHMDPLVGQEFVRDYQYSIDRDGGRMVLTKKTVKTSETDRPINKLYDVPCEVENDREYVTVNLNGQDVSHVLIDTGASSTILSMEMAAGAGIEIPPNAPVYSGGGVGGSVVFRQVFVRARLGPISYESFPVMVGGHAGSAIGQNFLQGRRFTVDREKKLMRFFH